MSLSGAADGGTTVWTPLRRSKAVLCASAIAATKVLINPV